MKVEVDSKEFGLALERAIEAHLKAEQGEKVLRDVLSTRLEKVDKILTDRNLAQLVEARLARVITIEKLKECIEDYSIEQYGAKLRVLINQATKASAELIKKEVKSLIKIG